MKLHHLPIKYWEGEVLEIIGKQFGKLLKVDDHTEKLSRMKFARICVEIDLSRPLKRDFWIGDEGHRCILAVLYERLLVFYYKCGLVTRWRRGW